ncbi:MAG: ribose-phosphate diphosphokinase, partial [Chloroflexi bacterium]|nr:ribose-phosphate diphosphokinase [Chloroflexota bacterium]
PVDELTALPLLSRYMVDKELKKPVAVAVDIGGTKRARNMAERIGAPLAIVEKRRMGNEDKLETLNVIGDVEGRIAVMIDDEVATGGSLLSTIDALRERGVTEVYACCTHGVLSGNAAERIAASPIKELVVTDTLPVDENKRNGKTTVLSVAPILGEAIHRIHHGLSVGAMFE